MNNEHMYVNPPWNPGESVAAWLRGTGENNARLRNEVTELQAELYKAKQSRARLVDAMQELQSLLQLPHQNPSAIVAAVKKLVKP